jgi:hypothetical protein
MKAISLYQPWASLIAAGHKHYETRDWPITYRGPLAIHAGRRWTNEEKGYLNRLTDAQPKIRDHFFGGQELPFGAVICVVNVVDCVRTENLIGLTPLEKAVGNFGPGRYAWKLELVKVFEQPIPCQGKQGLWNWEMPSEAADPQQTALPSMSLSPTAIKVAKQPTPSAPKGRMAWYDAAAVAGAILSQWRPATKRIAVGGSIRRGAADVGDVEIIAVSQGADLHDLLDQWLAEGKVQKRLKSDGSPIAWKDKYRAMLYHGVAVDLFITSPAQWGIIYLIRTGPGTCDDPRWKGGPSQMIVTQRSKGGLLPNDLNVKDGWIWRGDKRLSTPEESDVWKLLGIPEIAPYERTIATYSHWRGCGSGEVEALRDEQWYPLSGTGRAKFWPAVGYPGRDNVFRPMEGYFVPYTPEMLIRLYERRRENPITNKISVTMGVSEGVGV